MTHGGGILWFLPFWAIQLFVVVMVAAPGLVVLWQIYRRVKTLGVIATVGFVGLWARVYFLWLEHARLQEQAAKAADCVGYAQLPERCWSAMNGPHVTPDGLFVWSGAALGLSFLGLAIVWYDSIDWDKYRRKWGKFRRALGGLVPV